MATTPRDALIIAEDVLRRLKDKDRTVTESVVENALQQIREARRPVSDDNPRVFPGVDSHPADDQGLRLLDLASIHALQGILANPKLTKAPSFTPVKAAEKALSAGAALTVKLLKVK